MRRSRLTIRIAAVFLVSTLSAVASFSGEAPIVDEQIAAMQAMCAGTEEARAQRQTENPLYHRLGGYDKIHDLTTEIVRLHNQNTAIKAMFTDVNSAELATHVADFVAVGTGGSETYAGRSLPDTHINLHLTDADFLSAGGDIVTAMTGMGYGENEINEVVCILVSLKDQVVFE